VKENEQEKSQEWGKEQALANEREPSSELQRAELEQEARQIEREWEQTEPSWEGQPSPES
jgi:hypothetical protein